MEIGFCGNSLGLNMGAMCWDNFEQWNMARRLTVGTCGYRWYGLWILGISDGEWRNYHSLKIFDIVSWQKRRLNNSTKYLLRASMTTTSKKKNRNPWENCQVCSQIVLKCLYLARIGRPDILWSVNNFARSITKWTKACDKRLNRLISYIHHTCEFK